MAEPVQGYLTSDGVYYASRHAAEAHEHRNTIRDLCESHQPKPIEAEKFLTLIEAWADPIRNYINANEAQSRYTQAEEDTTGTNRDQANDTNRDVDFDALVEQPTGRHEPMPNVGHRSQGEGVLQRSKINGVRGRGDDA